MQFLSLGPLLMAIALGFGLNVPPGSSSVVYNVAGAMTGALMTFSWVLLLQRRVERLEAERRRGPDAPGGRSP